MRSKRAIFFFAILLPAVSTSLGAQPCGTPGRDGSGTITGTVNTYYPGTATATAGATSLSVGSPSGAATAIGAGDLLLVIQMQDAAINSNNSGSYGDGGGGDPATGSTALNNSGIYEFVVATGPVAAGVLPFLGGGSGGKLLNTYTLAAATGTQGQRRFQVIRVPQYSSATLSSGLTALAWNGSVGGVLSIDVSGTLALGSATVSVDGLGFRGGGGRSLSGDGSAHDYRCLSTGNAHGSKAEGIAGTPRWVYDGTTLTDTGVEGYPNGSYCKGAPGNAGGGGTDDSTTNSNNSGGGGGGNGGTGGLGGNTWSTNLAQGGFGGSAFAATAARLALGGGGGAGTSNNAGPAHGGPGGGLILFRFNARSGTGTLSANGATPPDSTQDGAGGGGAGGTVFATACTAGALTGLTVHAQGARGGNVNWTAGDFHGPGGGGGGGVSFLSGAAAAVSLTAGANGTSPTATAYGATSGTAGTSSTAATTSSAPGARPGCVCAVTQALITELHSVPQGNAAVVEWQTSSEAATAGFYLFRVDPETGAWKRLNERLLSPVTEAPQGGVYQLLDESASPSEPASYALVEVQNDGRQRTYGPFRVVPDGRESLVPLSRMRVDGYARAPRRPPGLTARLERAKAIVKPGQPAPGKSSQLKLFVHETGVYVLTAAQIAAGLGVSPSTVTDWIAQRHLGLAGQGLPVPWQGAPDNASIRFFGEASSSQYAAENVYQLLPGILGSVMRTVDGGSPAAIATPPFHDSVHYEQDNFAGIAIAPDPDSDYWFWDVLIAGDPSYGTRTYPLDVYGVAGTGTAALTVHLQGATSSGNTGEHRVTVSLNASILGDVVWQQVQPATAAFTFSPSLLREGSNSVALTAQLQPGIPYSISYLESFDLGYDRLARADGAPLVWRPAAGAGVTVTGFASPQVLVYDVTQAKSATAVTGTTVDSTVGGYRVSFRPAAAGRLFVALDASSLRTPRIVPWSPPVTSLLSTTNGADHLIITTADLAGGAESLAAFRRSQGLDSQVVTVEQIWDELNGGLPDPHALQRFLAFAATAWSKRPTSVVLAGKGTYDYRDHLGLGGNLVPPLMVRTSEGLFASDSQLAAGSGLVIGRLPVTSAASLQSVVDKLIAYESAGAGDWQRQVLMVADNPDPGGQFDWESDLAAALVPSPYRATRLYLGPLSLTDLRRQLLAGLGSGAFLVNYIGHGGLDRLAAEPILANDDAANLNNGDRLPVVAAMACILGRFEVPGFTSFAETLIDNPHGGAAAVWAPSGVNYNAQSGALDRALFAQLFKSKATTLGDAVRGAAASFLTAGGSGNTLLTYNLFGDPAMRLRRGD